MVVGIAGGVAVCGFDLSGVGCMVFWVVFSLWVFVCWVALGLLCAVVGFGC